MQMHSQDKWSEEDAYRVDFISRRFKKIVKEKRVFPEWNGR
jgi:hypothetical protein